MTEDRRSAAGIFADAVELPPGERPAFLDASCGVDTPLRVEVDSLLEVFPAARSYFEGASPAEGLPGFEIGAYRIVRLIAHGGMGSVYLGERTDPAYRKQVAIKLLRPGPGGDDLFERFNRERQLLADLEHPGIARLIDGGSTRDGVPYLVMEFVDGVPIGEHCDAAGLSQTGRLELFLEVCDAVSYAHRNLVIHRDLKPGNILVDRSGRPRLLDFGIAKVLEDGSDSGGATRTALRAMTPGYASPEQARGGRMTTGTDVYSLGVILYEMLSGRMPYDVRGASPSRVERLICEEPPAHPGLRNDLDTVILKALSKEPGRRYPSVDDLADDIRRFRDGLPVRARPDTAAYRISKFVRRHRTLVGSVLAVLAILLVSLVVTIRAYHQTTARSRELQWMAYTGALAAAESSELRNDLAEAERYLAGAPAALRGWEWHHLHARLDRSMRSWQAHTQGITSITFSRDGTRFVTTSIDSTACLWNASTGERLRVWNGFGSGVESAAIDPAGRFAVLGLSTGGVRLLPLDADGTGTALATDGSWAMVAVSKDGARIAAGFFDGTLATWDAATGAPIARWTTQEQNVVIAYTHDGKLVSAGGRGTVRTWNDGGQFVTTIDVHRRRIYSLATAPGDDRIVAGSIDHVAAVIDPAGHMDPVFFREHGGTVGAVAFSADGRRVISSGADGSVFAWDAATGVSLAEFRGHRADVSALAVPSEGPVVTGDWGGVIKQWSGNSDDVRTLHRSEDRSMVTRVRCLAIDQAGQRLAWTDETGVWLQDLGPGTSGPPASWNAGTRVVFAPGAKTLVAGMSDGRILLVDVAAGRIVRETRAHAGEILGLAVSPDGTSCFTSAARSPLEEWSLPELTHLRTLAAPDTAGILDIEVAPGGGTIVTACDNGVLRTHDSSTGTERWRVTGHAAAIADIAIDPSGGVIASVAADGSARLWDLEGGRERFALAVSGPALRAVAFSRDGSRIAAAGAAQIVKIFDTRTGRELIGLHGHVARVSTLAFTPGDRGLVSGAYDGTIRLWDADATGQPSLPRDPR